MLSNQNPSNFFKGLKCFFVCFGQDGFPKNTDCGVSLGCFNECKGDCTFEVTWRDTGTSVEFTLKSSLSQLASGGNWIAVALSSDKEMVN